VRQEQFERIHAPDWSAFQEWLDKLEKRKRDAVPQGSDYPALYRRICHHLALARAREYSPGLQQRLNHMALEGHQYLYRQQGRTASRILQFIVNGFPSCVRSMRGYVLASSLLFFGSWAAIAIAIVLKPDVIYSILEPVYVERMEGMYDARKDTLGRESESDLKMFGFYIYNNISIGFRTFASGLLFGIGTIFTIVYNGLVIGGIATHLTVAGYGETFWGFVAGHSSFELIAIVLFGAAGLGIGRQFIAPGRKPRWQAIRDQAALSLPIIYGATLMLLTAAFVEAYWSSGTWLPANVKYAVGGALWLLHIVYFVALGRHEPQ
jgi:uncharacterized membrane protein SpoIIM required for sporulation